MKVTNEKLSDIVMVHRQYYFEGCLYGNWHQDLYDKDFLTEFINYPLKTMDDIEDEYRKIERILE